jgi:hypothetical protein
MYMTNLVNHHSIHGPWPLWIVLRCGKELRNRNADGKFCKNVRDGDFFPQKLTEKRRVNIISYDILHGNIE